MRAPPLTPLAAAALHAGTPERVLVIGSGEGDAALFLAREFPSARIRGVDPSDVAVREATARIGLDPEGRVAFKVGRAGDLPFPDDFFDLVAQVDARPSAAEVARVLKAGGHLIVAASSRPRRPFGMTLRRLTRGLARRGFEPVEIDEAGDGAFYVGRLRGD